MRNANVKKSGLQKGPLVVYHFNVTLVEPQVGLFRDLI